MRTITRFTQMVAVAAGSSLVVLSAPAQATAAGTHNVWHPVASMSNPDSADANTAATGDPNGNIYVAGGSDSLGYSYTDFSVYNPIANVWKSLAPLPQDTSNAAAAAGPSGMVFVAGGFTDNGGPQIVSATYGYSPKRNIWIAEPSMPTAREYLAAATGPDGRIYALGGQDSHGNTLNIVEAFNPTTSLWSTVAPLPTARWGLAAVTGSDGHIYAIGGFTASGPTGIVEAYNVYTNTWTRVANVPTSETYCAALASNARIYAVQATTTVPKTLTATVHTYAYNTSTNAWTRVANMQWRGGESCASIPAQPHIYSIGGYAMGGYYPKAWETNTVLQYTL